ncbi:MAG: GAF domain-containing protein, partial [Anaerolineae bacterium]
MGAQFSDNTGSILAEAGYLNLDALVISPSMPELLRAIVAWAVELMRADAGEVFLWDDDRGCLVQSIGYGSMERYIGLALKPGEGIVGRVFSSGRPMIVPDYASWPGRLAVYTLEGPTTDITVPMKWNDQIMGVMGITADSKRRTFGEEDIQPATIFANLAALAIHNHRLCDVLQNRAHTLKAVLDSEVAVRTAQLAHRALQLETSAHVSRQITSILDTETLVSSVVELIKQAFDYPYVLIFLRDEKRNALVLRASTVAISERYRRLEIDRSSLNGTAALTNQPMLVRDTSKYNNYLSDPDVLV